MHPVFTWWIDPVSHCVNEGVTFSTWEHVFVKIYPRSRMNWRQSKSVKNPTFLSSCTHFCSLRLIVGSISKSVYRWRSLPSYRLQFEVLGVESGKFLLLMTLFNSYLHSQLAYILHFSAFTGFVEACFVVRLAQIVHLLGADLFTRINQSITASVLVRSRCCLICGYCRRDYS